jgi:hypothetical protein
MFRVYRKYCSRQLIGAWHYDHISLRVPTESVGGGSMFRYLIMSIFLQRNHRLGPPLYFQNDINDPINELNLMQYCNLFEVAAKTTGNDNIGLEFGQTFSPANSAPLDLLQSALRHYSRRCEIWKNGIGKLTSVEQ